MEEILEQLKEMNESLRVIAACLQQQVATRTATQGPRALRRLAQGQHRALVTKMQITPEGWVRLFFRGCQYESTKLFDLADLAEAGIVDFDQLPVGEMIPTRFFCVYGFSEKKNKEGNPYRDVLWIEPAEGYAVTTEGLGDVVEATPVNGGQPPTAVDTASTTEETSPDEDLEEYFGKPPEAEVLDGAIGPNDFWQEFYALRDAEKISEQALRQSDEFRGLLAQAQKTQDFGGLLKFVRAQVRT
ncbi:hypothetical protein GF348_24545 [candidate division KSB3 bacterium]|nr:hypothetical protein [candidate division KSB3 bacterium]